MNAAEKVAQRKRVIHQSDIGQLTKCGLGWKLKNIDKIEAPTGVSLLLGNVMDSLNTAFIRHRLAAKADITLEQAKQYAIHQFSLREHETVFQEDETSDSVKAEIIQLVECYFASMAPQLRPIAVQKRFVIETGLDFDLGGTRDLDEEKHVVTDLKICARQSRDRYDVKGAIQPAMYSLAYQVEYGVLPTFRFALISRPSKTKPAELRFVEGKVSQGDIDVLLYAASQANRMIEAGIFMPADDNSWLCGPKYCEFYAMCKGRL